jgi:hypothetical protein
VQRSTPEGLAASETKRKCPMPLSPKARKIVSVISIATIAGGLLWLAYGSGPSLPKAEIRRYEALGQVGMREIKKLSGDQTEILLLLPAEKVVDPFDYSKQEQQALALAATDAGLHLAVERYTYGSSPAEFFVLLRKHPNVGVAMTDALPETDDAGWKQLQDKAGPKVVLIGVPEFQAGIYLKAHLVPLAIAYRENKPTNPGAFNSVQECFDYYYRIMTP